MAFRISLIDNDAGGLERFGFLRRRHRLAIHATGEQGLWATRSRAPDVVLVNFRLPTMDGFELVRKLRARWPALPALMYTMDRKAEVMNGHMDYDLIFAAAHAGANGYLPKALPARDVLKSIGQLKKGAQCDRRIFLMFFEADRGIGRMAMHWKKIKALVNPVSTSIAYGPEWQKVVL